jgi:hypothetical protein
LAEHIRSKIAEEAPGDALAVDRAELDIGLAYVGDEIGIVFAI